MSWRSKGYKVKLVNASIAPICEGVGQGSLDLFMDGWLPHDQGNYWNKVTATAHKVNSWYESPYAGRLRGARTMCTAQLKTHASEFNNQIIGIDPGAGEMTLEYGFGNSGDLVLVGHAGRAVQGVCGPQVHCDHAVEPALGLR